MSWEQIKQKEKGKNENENVDFECVESLKYFHLVKSKKKKVCRPKTHANAAQNISKWKKKTLPLRSHQTKCEPKEKKTLELIIQKHM